MDRDRIDEILQRAERRRRRQVANGKVARTGLTSAKRLIAMSVGERLRSSLTALAGSAEPDVDSSEVAGLAVAGRLADDDAVERSA